MFDVGVGSRRLYHKGGEDVKTIIPRWCGWKKCEDVFVREFYNLLMPQRRGGRPTLTPKRLTPQGRLFTHDTFSRSNLRFDRGKCVLFNLGCGSIKQCELRRVIVVV